MHSALAQLPFAFLPLWGTIVAGVVAVAVPIIIHLLNRRRFKIVVWAAMRFLLNAQKQTTRKMRLEQLILLMVRCTALLLVVLAMASITPWAQAFWDDLFGAGGGGGKRRAARIYKVIVVDGSLSMSAKAAGGKTCFDNARALALQIAKDSPAGDGLSVVLMKDTPSWEVAGPAHNPRRVAKVLQNLRPAHGNADVPATLNAVAAKVAEAHGRFDACEVYFLTDLQRNTWLRSPVRSTNSKDTTPEPQPQEKAAFERIQEHAKTFFVDVGRDGVNNLAVTNVTVSTGRGDQILLSGQEAIVQAAVHNFGSEPRANLRVELLVGRAAAKAGDDPLKLSVVRAEHIDVRAGQQSNVSFTHRFPEAGTYVVQVRIEPDDLPVDDSRSLVVTVRDRIPVLIVDDSPDRELIKERTARDTEVLRERNRLKEADCVRLALNPTPDRAITTVTPAFPEVVADLARVSDDQLAGYDCVFLCDVTQLRAGDVHRLRTHLRRGGGLVFSLGKGVAGERLQNIGGQAIKMDSLLATYNRLLFEEGRELLPAQLEGLRTAPAKALFTLNYDPNALDEPPLYAFGKTDRASTLRSAPFYKYVQARAVSDGSARTVLTFAPHTEEKDPKALTAMPANEPAMVEWNPPLPSDRPGKGAGPSAGRYRGKVVLFTSTLNFDWDWWPRSLSFGSMMQETLRFTIAGKVRPQSALVGGTLEQFLRPGAADVTALVYLPGAEKPVEEVVRGSGEATTFRWGETDLSGLYTVKVRGEPQEHLFAVNVPVGGLAQKGPESDLKRIDQDGLRSAYPGWKFDIVTALSQVRHADAPAGQSVEEDGSGGRHGQEVARWLLFALLLLLLVEPILALFFAHHSPTATAGPPPGGWLVPGLTAAAALLVIVPVAGTFLHALATGDFLGFMPDGFREWVEGLFGISSPGPGETRIWPLEFTPFLIDEDTDFLIAIFLGIGGVALVLTMYFFEAKAAPGPDPFVAAALRVSAILFTLFVLFFQIKIDLSARQSWPDVVLLVDDSLSMGVPDFYRDEATGSRAKALADELKKEVEQQQPARIEALRKELVEKQNARAADHVRRLEAHLKALEAQRDQLASGSWRPTRLQLAQALLARKSPDWVGDLVNRRKLKLHIFHLDQTGKLAKLQDPLGRAAGEITSADPAREARARQAVLELYPKGEDSLLSSAVKQILNEFRGAHLAGIIMLTDGVTTRGDPPLEEVAQSAKNAKVPLFLVGLGDEHKVRSLKLHDLEVADVVYVNDWINFDARLTSPGYEGTVPVVLKLREKDGTEKVLTNKERDKDGKEVEREVRTEVRLDPRGSPQSVKLRYQADKPGEKVFVVEALPPPGMRGPEAKLDASDLRLQRSVLVQDMKTVKVLYIEGSPRYEWRFIKNLLEREEPGTKKVKSVELKVLLLDADEGFPDTDKSALADFPPTKQALDQFDVVILGDVDPRSPRLGDARLQQLADFVTKRGGGLLMIAGTQFSPHAFKGTPVGKVLPIEPGQRPGEPEDLTEPYRPVLTFEGKRASMFKQLSPNDPEPAAVLRGLAPMYWWSHGYRALRSARVLAVHPKRKAEGDAGGRQGNHPLVVEHQIGRGRCLFFGFDETWRWRFRADEGKFDRFWLETVRYLSRPRVSHTTLRLDQQAPYRAGKPIRVTVEFPEDPFKGVADPGKKQVTVQVEHRPADTKGGGKTEMRTLTLSEVKGKLHTYEGVRVNPREGKYKFTLFTPDVSGKQPSGEQPSAEAVVIRPPGELDELAMNLRGLTRAGEEGKVLLKERGKRELKPFGGFYNLVNADRVIEDLPELERDVLKTPRPPVPLWNHFLAFVLVLGVLTVEWLLRKRKHLL
jgi:hypothetical protein